ncbi:Senescence-related protein 1 [Heracleum sosnowskyi]|uniref:Senescence-related protein 1 n=1 Tax=Heracleum sosnowskyi TaxID=360622 RepID=A0AAD8IB47_9APIA|nr:Senescence-related protein 1 [Heracleum sosnowskyi]KAK1381957.1 Senescence-related protein 1 [Heracleum sosnowskyi]
MEVAKVKKIASSLQVPSVQELARETSAIVPLRYVQSDQDPVILSSTNLLEVPVIDMEILLDGDLMQAELNKLHLACKEWGFFQLINHGVSDSLLEKVKTGVEEFFKLPLEEKRKFGQLEGDIEGYGQAFVVSNEQKLDWADLFYMITLPTDIRKPHLLPQLPQSFRNAIEAYSGELKSLAMKILNLMAKALHMNPKDIEVLFEEGMQSMRTNHYPPCPQPEQVIGVSPHSDATGLTILFQLNEIEGLQIRKDGIWIPIKLLPSAFVINIGDVVEVVTNGIYRSIEHRGVVNSVKERMSIATFLSPKLDGEFGPAPSLISSETPPMFKRIGAADFLKGYFAQKLSGRCYLDTLRI